jgi:hypothetical protein
MIDTAYLKRITNMTDEELESRRASAYNIAFGETFCNDDEAYSEARQTYHILEREWNTRRAASKQRV